MNGYSDQGDPGLSETISMAERALESGDIADAKMRLLPVLAEEPQNIAALNDLAVAEIVVKNWASASSLISRVLSVDGKNSVALNNLQVLNNSLRRREVSPVQETLAPPEHFRAHMPSAPQTYFMDEYLRWERNTPRRKHSCGVFSSVSLRKIEGLLPEGAKSSAETGCGKSTILFSNISESHKVFALDDRASGADSSVNYFLDCPLTKLDRIETIYGPTQETLPNYKNHPSYDFVMIDGPHAYPFPELEYYYFYPHIISGGILVLDDVNIPTIGRLADFIAEDDMFELVSIVSTTAIFRRTGSPVFDPRGDGWWEQKYNRRRVSKNRDIYLSDTPANDEVSSKKLDHICYP